MFIGKVFEELTNAPWKKFHLFDPDGRREYVISTDHYMGIEPHFITYQCFREGKDISSVPAGGFDGNIPIQSDEWEEVTEEMTREEYEDYAYDMWGED